MSCSKHECDIELGTVNGAISTQIGAFASNLFIAIYNVCLAKVPFSPIAPSTQTHIGWKKHIQAKKAVQVHTYAQRSQDGLDHLFLDSAKILGWRLL